MPSGHAYNDIESDLTMQCVQCTESKQGQAGGTCVDCDATSERSDRQERVRDCSQRQQNSHLCSDNTHWPLSFAQYSTHAPYTTAVRPANAVTPHVDAAALYFFISNAKKSAISLSIVRVHLVLAKLTESESDRRQEMQADVHPDWDQHELGRGVCRAWFSWFSWCRRDNQMWEP
jgi:hypothetical protein